MAYADVCHIEMYYEDRKFESSDYINSQQVRDYIDQVEAIVNARLSNRYETPITNSTDVLLIRHIIVGKVVHIIDDITREKDSNEGKQYQRATKKEADDLLKKIESGEILLQSTAKKSPIKFNNTDSNTETVEPHFKYSEADASNWA